MSNAEELLNEDIRLEFSKHHSVFRTARALGIAIPRVEAVVRQDDFVPESGNTRYDGWGKPELRKYVVARKHVNDQWDNNDVGIKNARTQYEKGSHEMTTGRDGDWLVLYSIPRAVVQPRPNYFNSRSE